MKKKTGTGKRKFSLAGSPLLPLTDLNKGLAEHMEWWRKWEELPEAKKKEIRAAGFEYPFGGKVIEPKTEHLTLEEMHKLANDANLSLNPFLDRERMVMLFGSANPAEEGRIMKNLSNEIGYHKLMMRAKKIQCRVVDLGWGEFSGGGVKGRMHTYIVFSLKPSSGASKKIVQQFFFGGGMVQTMETEYILREGHLLKPKHSVSYERMH